MPHSLIKKNHTHAYVTARPLEHVLKVFDDVPHVIPLAVVRFASPSEVRVETPGALVTVLIQAAADSTRLIARFKSSAGFAWRKIVELLHASVQVRRIEAPQLAVSSKPVSQRGPRRVSDVVERFLEDKSVAVVFAPKALRQAKDSGFRHPDQVLEVLNGLVAAAGLLNAGVPTGVMVRDLYKLKAGLRGYRPRLSDTQLTAYRDDYVAIYDGEEFVGEMHVTIGRGGEAECLSIHWAYCPKRRLIIITRCSTHGRSARS